MPRKPRFYMPNVPVHVVQRGNSRRAIFLDDSDYEFYLECVGEAVEKYGCQVHAYVLMTNHVHLLVSPEAEDSLGRMMQFIGTRYVPYINKTYKRSGSLWEGRYKASLIQTENYFLTCMRYIELNPVRARGMVNKPGDYRWSSYQGNAYARKDSLLTPHQCYLDLGASDVVRRRAYRALFDGYLDRETMKEIHSAWQSGTPLGSDHFRLEIEQALQVSVGYAKRGRPRKVTDL